MVDKQEKLCIDCDKPIPKLRLEVLPNAIRCVACAEQAIEQIKAELKPDPDAEYPRGW